MLAKGWAADHAGIGRLGPLSTSRFHRGPRRRIPALDDADRMWLGLTLPTRFPVPVEPRPWYCSSSADPFSVPDGDPSRYPNLSGVRWPSALAIVACPRTARVGHSLPTIQLRDPVRPTLPLHPRADVVDLYEQDHVLASAVLRRDQRSSGRRLAEPNRERLRRKELAQALRDQRGLLIMDQVAAPGDDFNAGVWVGSKKAGLVLRAEGREDLCAKYDDRDRH